MARRTAVVGVLNVTPDSFSDGGRFEHLPDALAHARRMLDEGADALDIGGESSRPAGKTYGAGASRVPIEEEIARVVPLIERLSAETDAILSVDTVKPEVARAALAAGATVVNDVSNGSSPALLRVAAEAEATLVLMHTRDGGRVTPPTTSYADVVEDVLRELLEAAERAVEHGVARDKLVIDPGIGFAKTAEQSAALLGNLDAFVASGYPVLVGASRKSFIAQLEEGGAPSSPPDRRLGGSLAAVTAAALAGCAAVRVHDVFESWQAACVAGAMRSARRSAP